MEERPVDDKKLYRSRIDRMIGGVCGGFAEYLVIDATLMRILWIILGFMGFGLFAYIACLIIMKENPHQDPTTAPLKTQNTSLIVGAGLILLGLMFISSNFDWHFPSFYHFHWPLLQPWFNGGRHILPVLLIILGAFYIYHVMKKGKTTSDGRETTDLDSQNSETKLKRSAKDKMIAGVCGGLAEYFHIDTVFIRITWVLLTLFTGFIIGILFYIVLMIILPENVALIEPPKPTKQKKTGEEK